MKRCEVECSVEKQSDKPRTFRFVGSTAHPNRMGDIIEVEGWETSNWERNPVILWGHNMNIPPIGRGTVQQRSKPKALVFDVEFAPADISPLAGEIMGLVEHGFVKGVSVGFMPIEMEQVDPEDESWFAPVRYKKQELLELSIVSVPANPQTLIMNKFHDNRVLRNFLTFKRGESIEQDLPKVRGLIFSKEKFNTAGVARWAQSYGFEEADFKENKKSYLLEVDPNVETDGVLHLIEEGVHAVFGTPEEKPVRLFESNNPRKIQIEGIGRFEKAAIEIVSSNKETQTVIQSLATQVGELSKQVSKFSYLTELTKEDGNGSGTQESPEESASDKIVQDLMSEAMSIRKQISGV